VKNAGILIIGNEILSAKVEDENAPYLLRELRRQGIDVERVHTIPDVIDVIAAEVKRFANDFTYVFTTGGVGPTHDDVTMDGVAAAFGCKLARHAGMEEMLIKALRGREANASQLKMCDLPEGAELIETPDMWFPLVRMHNVYVFPGIPRLLQLKFEASRDEWKGSPVFLRRLFLSCVETDIAHHLNELLVEFEALDLGSYPKVGEEDHRTLITLESRDSDYVDRALESLVGRIPSGDVVRVE